MFPFKLANIGVSKRAFSSTVANAAKVAVLGAAGGIGQPLSLLLKKNELISHLSLYDIVSTPGVAADLSHINTASKVKFTFIFSLFSFLSTINSLIINILIFLSKVTGYVPENDGLKLAVSDADFIVIPAGVPRKPGMSRDDLFNVCSFFFLL
jgi:malate dehydrogenase